MNSSLLRRVEDLQKRNAELVDSQDSDEADPENPIRAHLREVLKQLENKVGPYSPFDFNTLGKISGLLFALAQTLVILKNRAILTVFN